MCTRCIQDVTSHFTLQQVPYTSDSTIWSPLMGEYHMVLPPWDITLIAVSLPLFKTFCKILFQEHQLPNCVLLNLLPWSEISLWDFWLWEKAEVTLSLIWAVQGLRRPGWHVLKKKTCLPESTQLFWNLYNWSQPHLTQDYTASHHWLHSLMGEWLHTCAARSHLSGCRVTAKIRDQFLLCHSLTVTSQILPRQTTWKVKTKVQKQDFKQCTISFIKESTL